MKKSICIVLSLFLLSAGHSWAAGSHQREFSLDETLKLVPGRISKAELIQRFGKPDLITDFSKIPRSNSTDTEWVYKAEGQDRVIVVFEKESEMVASWSWIPKEGATEQDLAHAKGLFPSSAWELETDRWINPHAHPSECLYIDTKSGFSLKLNLVRQKVVAILRWNPLRTIASNPQEKPPVYCLGSACTPAIAAKEFFKGSSVSEYCEKFH